MIQNFMKHVSFYCINHDTPVPLVASKGYEYVCPKGQPVSDDLPNGYGPEEEKCETRIMFSTLMDAMDKFMEEVEKNAAMNMFMDYKNYNFVYRGNTFVILRYSPYDVRIGVKPKGGSR